MSELEKTIEELEAEVLAELEEASQPDDSGGKADAPKKVKDEVNKEEDGGNDASDGEPHIQEGLPLEIECHLLPAIVANLLVIIRQKL